MENQLTTIDCLIMVQAAYPRSDFGSQTIQIYRHSLADIDPLLLRTAVLKHISVSKWLPTIAELRQRSIELLLEAQGHLSAPEAWGLVSREIQRVGHWGTPDVPQAVRAAIDASGGWRSLCLSAQETADRARFLEAYSTICKREVEKLQQMPAVTAAQQEIAKDRQQVDTAVAGLLSRMKGADRRRPQAKDGDQE